MKHLLRVLAFAALCALAFWGQAELRGVLGGDLAALRPLDALTWPWVAGFLAFCVLANSVLWPTLASGLLFGGVSGAGLAVLGVFLGGAIQFLVIRGFLREPAEAWFADRLRPVQTALESRGLAVMVVWRLLWLPAPLITVAAALTHIPLWQHLLAMVAMVPGIVAVAWLADGLALHGLWRLPADQWVLLGATFVLTGGVWAVARQAFPELRFGNAPEAGPPSPS